MQCAKSKAEMHTIAMDTLTIDECPQCGGIWFDQGEYHDVRESTDTDLVRLNIDFWKNQEDVQVVADDLTCPNCRRYYLIRLEDPATGTNAKMCSDCRGIWLDADQLTAAYYRDAHRNRPSDG